MTHSNSQQGHAGSCDEYQRLDRRQLLRRAGAFGAAASASTLWAPRLSQARAGGTATSETLIYVFLRGGMDALTLVAPYGDADLYNFRPTLAVQPPGQTNGAIDLDGFFGLAPAAAPLLAPYQAGDLAVIHALGNSSPGVTRSHFEAMRLTESASQNLPAPDLSSGWLGRHLSEITPVVNGGVRGIALMQNLPLTLAGGPKTLPIPDPSVVAFPGNPATATGRQGSIVDLYSLHGPMLQASASDTLGFMDFFTQVGFSGYTPANGASYPASPFGQAMLHAAAMIKADLGVEVIEIDKDGWDTHSSQLPFSGNMAFLMDDLARGLEALWKDLSAQLGRVTVVVQSEFGRRVDENGSGGHDHGHGGAMLVMGGNVNGGQVLGTWPGLALANQDDMALAVTTDYRDVIAEILSDRMGNTTLSSVFPNYTPNFLGVTN
ncbi:MAG: hypothetical protein ACI8QC_001938 [Planctomycetota bacterium]|jgi:uncharacterized protein (DUF1501 family)